MCVGLCIEYRLWKNGTVSLAEKEYRNGTGLGPVSSSTGPVEMMTCVHF